MNNVAMIEELSRNYFYAKSFIQAGLVNYTRFKEEERELFYHLDLPELDLALCFYFDIAGCRVFVTKYMVEEWGAPADDLYRRALENTIADFPGRYYVGFNSTDPTYLDYMSDLEIQRLKTNSGILTSKSTIYKYGATAILYPGMLKQVCSNYGENIAIFPSSIKNVMTCPRSIFDDIDGIMSLVRDVNRFVVSPENVLSDYLYEYSADTDSIRVANSEKWYPIKGFFGLVQGV